MPNPSSSHPPNTIVASPLAGGEPALAPSPSLGAVFDTVLANADIKEATRQTYRRAIVTFQTWFAASEERHNATTLVRFKRYLEQRTDIAPATKSLYLNTARLLYRRLFEMGATDRDFSRSVRGFQLSTRHKRAPISDTSIAQLYSYLDAKGDPRLRALFDLLFRQGLRRNEVVTLRVTDVNLADGTIAVYGKGRDDRDAVFLHSETAKSLSEYMQDEGLRDGYLFPSRKNKEAHITTTRLYQIVMQVHSAIQIDNSPHAYRKAFTSRLIDADMNLLTVQQFTRHRSLDMLKVYYDRKDLEKKLPLFETALQSSPQNKASREI